MFPYLAEPEDGPSGLVAGCCVCMKGKLAAGCEDASEILKPLSESRS